MTEVKRDTNLELYRIFCMLLIVAHHYVVNSGLLAEILNPLPLSAKSAYLYVLGMWGKVGINCFLMITGYFMCVNRITLRKFIKILAEIYFYSIVIYIIFLIAGRETLSMSRVFQVLLPVRDFDTDFTSCFVAFYLTIPFWNILISNMNKKQHQLLLVFLIGIFSICGTIPQFTVSINYVTWFGVIYAIASYIRLYDIPAFNNKLIWMAGTIMLSLIAMASVISMKHFGRYPFAFVVDSNKFLALALAICSFLWFKNINIKYSAVINAIGGSTFGVLLIHAQSDAMRQWLWRDVIDCTGHYDLPIFQLVLYSLTSIFVIFAICVLIDLLRQRLLERHMLASFDRLHSSHSKIGDPNF